MLTLIKVPGKRKRKHRTDTEDGETKLSKPHARPKSRPRKEANKKMQVSTPLLGFMSAESKQSPPKKFKAGWLVTSLERLPTELLERIFLLSLNFDLPRSSPLIGSKLSNQHTYITATMAIFDPTWRYTYRCSIEQNWAGLDIDNGKEVPGNPELQSSLLRCKWATVTMLRKAEKAWLLNATPRPIKNHIEGPAKIPSSLPTSDSGQFIRITAHNSAKKLLHDSGHENFDEQYTEFLHLTKPQFAGVESISIQPVFQWETFLGVHPEAEIPESLLRGPWSPDMVMYLFWLTRAGAGIDYLESTSGEVARQGLDQAILDGNLQILYLLHCLGIETTVQEDILESTVRTCSGRKDIMYRVFLILASKYPDERPAWDRWLEDILESAESHGRSREEKRRQRIWWEDLVLYMLPLLKS